MLEFTHKKDISDGRRTIAGEVFYMSDLKYTVPGKGIVEVKVEKSARAIAQEARRRELAEKQAAREARWQKEKEKQELYRRLRQQDKQPVSATLICVQDTTGKNVLSTAVRGLVRCEIQEWSDGNRDRRRGQQAVRGACAVSDRMINNTPGGGLEGLLSGVPVSLT